MKCAPVATRDLPEPVGVDRMTFPPDAISMSASCWCGYSVMPCSVAHVSKAS